MLNGYTKIASLTRKRRMTAASSLPEALSEYSTSAVAKTDIDRKGFPVRGKNDFEAVEIVDYH